MFAIPRLAIVCGLLIFPHGPLNVERDNSDFPELFRPFKNLLRKIRDLLLTLSAAEFHVLERLLCQLEEPTDLDRKLKEAQQELEEKSRLSAGEDQAARLDERLTSCLALGPGPEEAKETKEMVEAVLADILGDVIKQSSTKTEEENAEESQSSSRHSSRRKSRSSSDGSKVPTALVEIDCTGPDITVSQVDREAEAGTLEREDRRQRQRLRVVEAGDTQGSQAVRKHKGHRRKGGRKYPKTGKDARARFKSSEDLIHRLYVCISGAADQLQTNFAGDFRSILKYVFIMNSSQEEEEEDVPETDEKSQESLSLSDNEESDVNPELSPDTVSLEAPEGEAESSATSEARPVMIRGQRGYECGEDALMSETEQDYLRSLPNQPQPGSGPASAARIDPRLLSTSPPAGLAAMPVYASNLDYHMGETGVLGAGETEDAGEAGRRFYQPEPALLTIAAGHPGVREEAETDRRLERRTEEPPTWIPDSMAPLCMGCGSAFSLVRRRHHCRSCGRVFCAKCSPNQVNIRELNSHLIHTNQNCKSHVL